MAEKLDVGESVNKCQMDYVSESLDLMNSELELQEELLNLEMCKVIKQSNTELAAVVSQLEDVISTLQFIIDFRIDFGKKLQSPIVLNALPVKYKQQQKFVNCFQKIPLVIDLLESVHKKPCVYKSLENQFIISHMEREEKLGKQYTNHIRQFLSAKSEFARNLNEIVKILHDVNLK